MAATTSDIASLIALQSRSQLIPSQVGKPIARTIDAVSACGNINLVHEDAATLEADYAHLHRLVDEGLFEVII